MTTDVGLYPLFDSCRTESYRELLSSGRLTKMQTQVFEALVKMGRATAEELVKFTGLPINTISGRCAELRDKKIIHIYDYRKNPVSGKINSVYEIV